MEVLLKKKRVLKGRFSRLEGLMEKRTSEEIFSEVDLHKVEQLEKEMSMLLDEIAQVCDEKDLDGYEKELGEIEIKLYELKRLITSRTRVARVETEHGGAELRLPRINLPIFSGQYSEWVTFHDLFVASIDKNVSLSNAQKLQYLKTAVQGEAAALIKTFAITDANYQGAWDMLLKRFHNHREIMNSHLDSLVKQSMMSNDHPETLRKLVDKTVEAVRSIKQQGAPVEQWDVILVYLISRKLDAATLRDWELSLAKDESPTYAKLMEYLDKRAHALLAARKTGHVSVPVKPGRVTSHHTMNQGECGQCKGTHTLSRCPEFIQKNVKERLEIVRRLKVCYNCLRAGHLSPKCQGGHCYKCPKYHHTLLHEEKSNNQSGGGVQPPVTSHHTSEGVKSKQVLLGTARVLVRGPDGRGHEARILVDSASQVSFMTEALAQRLQVKRWRSSQAVHTLGGRSVIYSKGRTKVILESIQEVNFSIEVNVLILPRITSNQPAVQIETIKWEHCKGLTLADEQFGCPGHVDMLLGADVYGQILKGGLCKGSIGMPVAIQTYFGWILLGEVQDMEASSLVSTYVVSTFDDASIQQFWAVKEEEASNWTEEEHECERHYKETYSRDENGRFVLRLPFKSSEIRLGESRRVASKRFNYGELKWRMDEAVWSQYKDFMEEYLQLNHMEKLDEIHGSPEEEYYLPHHAVIKLSSTTTKLRVVFDASAKTSTGVALNDMLMSGPKIQGDLIELLLRFQIPIIGMSADIAKMYRQVWIHQDDRKYLKILWRNQPQDSIGEYRLCTVTYGTACAPFQAIRSLQQIAEDGASQWPIASEVVKHDFYVDDLITGCASVEEGRVLVKELRELLGSAGFELRKWSCNQPEVLDGLDIELKEMKAAFNIGIKQEVKTLGIVWDPEQDQLSFMAPEYQVHKRITKRIILSDLARLFDPLGWLSPITIQGKIMFQQLWKEELNWDDTIPSNYEDQWKHYKNKVQRVVKIKIPRCLKMMKVKKYELHAFSDASLQAYAAVVYLRMISMDGSKGMRILAARTRVAPIRKQSLPRLELCAAVLTSQLTRTIKEALKQYKPDIYVYSDSMIVLAWIGSSPSRWKSFISHRIEEISKNLPGIRWNHIAGKENPADHATRCKEVTSLEEDVLWWQGPTEVEKWHKPVKISQDQEQQLQCEERRKVALIGVKCTWDLVERYSSLLQLIRVVAWILRFKKNVQGKKEERATGSLSVYEQQQSHKKCILLVQKEHFSEEIKQLSRNEPLHNHSRILSLNPFIDQDGIVHVGGRISKAKVSFQTRFPIILPGMGKFVSLLIQQVHLNLLHGGSTLVMATLRQKYWIINCRSAIRHVIHKCIPCHRQQRITRTQLMGELPTARVCPSRPFSHSGVDYAGPFTLHTMASGRAKRTLKAYVSVFVCFATKALHLELVSSLTTASFIAALRRFCGRRGRPSVLYSDCGSNFKGADQELKRISQTVKTAIKTQEMQTYLAQESITWQFNTPAAPHFGGIWEAAVKSMKGHLRRVIGMTVLNYEEMDTILVQIEACLNSRPLTPMSADPQDLEVLTPGHFLVGTPLHTLPDPDLSEKISLLSTWQHCQYMVQQFGKDGSI